ncbi:MAG: 4-oxalocrotonate tautomerase [Phycisphaera sp.]|nr:4-oxalocrotonate tautomerase [Phycisphaera sp.]
MPHVIVKLWPGKSDAQKRQLADRITKDVMDVQRYGEESVSVAFEEVPSSQWREQVYEPDIVRKQECLFKKPGYGIDDL